MSGTKIFGRSDEQGRQFLVYGMRFSSAEDVAMILPLPVPPNSPENAVRFIDLSDYPTFFEDIDRAFPQELIAPARSKGLSLPSLPTLPVHTVGAFDASFVPTQADFVRLDRRFRLPDSVWGSLPAYLDYGFAVFKLRRSGLLARLFGRRPAKVHPMAFSFPRRDPGQLFFPTIHVHDGYVHPRALFDHDLYYQPDSGGPPDKIRIGAGSSIPEGDARWTRSVVNDSADSLNSFVDWERVQGIVARDRPAFRMGLFGQRTNVDTILTLEA